ncbi:hypothetical protein A4S06_04515 [Erysipelotrichaceae bacterium MTC7]|nr:hypothetical protein A4S06_04515 [Erysipelotrichaceae bacterium MTC7]
MKLFNIHDLTYTRFFFDRKPPKYAIYTLLITLLFMIGFGIAITRFTKPYVVYGQGSIVSKENHYVSSNAQGVVVSIEANEGDYIKTGEILLVLSDGKNGSEVEALHDQYAQTKEKLSIMDLYEQSLREKTNHLQNKGLQQEYYGKVEYYLLQLAEEQVTKQRVQENLALKKEKLHKEQQALSKTTDSLEQEAKQASLENIQEEIKQLQQELQNVPQSEKLFYQFVSELGTQRTQVETQKQELESNTLLASTSASTYVIRASNEGYVHYLNPMYEGLSIQSNGVIAQISENEPKKWVVETYIDANEIAKVKVGQPVLIELNGLNSNVYPSIPGMVTSIDQGSLSQDSAEGRQLVYRMLVMMNYPKVKDTKSFQQLKKGMPVTCKIIYEEETYVDYLLTLLQLKETTY